MSALSARLEEILCCEETVLDPDDAGRLAEVVAAELLATDWSPGNPPPLNDGRGICLILDNDADSLRWAINEARLCLSRVTDDELATRRLAETLSAFMDGCVPDTPPKDRIQGVARELIRAGIRAIDWHEVAAHYITKAKEGASA